MSQTSNTTDESFVKAVELLQQLIGLDHIRQQIEKDECWVAQKIYTRLPVLTLLILQRLGGGLTLDEVVATLLKHHRDLLPPNAKRVQQATLSDNNSAYSNARSKLPLQVVEDFLHLICNHLALRAPLAWNDRRAFIIDGTTLTFSPTPELTKAFPPAINPQSQSVWPIALLTVATEMTTGCALAPQISPMYGKDASSETKQCRAIIERLPKESIVLADSGFGVFAVAWHCGHHGQDFLFRLSKQRFKSYKRRAEVVEETATTRTWRLQWKASDKDKQNNPELPGDAEMQVFLHCIKLDGGESLYLVTSLEVDAWDASERYRKRYDVEFDIRDLKVTMDAENIQGRSMDTAIKELYASVIAFNLVMQFRRQAAERVSVPPRRLSFSGVWLTFRTWLLGQSETTSYAQWLEVYEETLKRAGKRKLPIRSKPRSYPRKAHSRAPKSTKFQKALRRKKTHEPPSDPQT